MLKKHVHSFRNAISGLMWIVQTQPNFRIHLSLSLLAIAAGYALKINHSEFLIILSMIGMGLALEAVNTAIEEAIDAIHKDWSEEIKVAKDVSAAAMLIFAITALIVASIIFIPRLSLFINF